MVDSWWRAPRSVTIGNGFAAALVWAVFAVEVAVLSVDPPSLRTLGAACALFWAGFALAHTVWILRAPARAQEAPSCPPSFEHLVGTALWILTLVGLGSTALVLNVDRSPLTMLATGVLWVLVGFRAGGMAVRLAELLWRTKVAPPLTPPWTPPPPYGPVPRAGGEAPQAGGAPPSGRR
ncbi:hypothetical protein CLV56_1936 [Mumia flava]|uniref:Uncharacterized protein n=1 Tax=Mumia flava TaxID=1348852 RepID=A0A0B2B1Z8_9ACTN|nr:hypothetical protein CLV56_1936 [Mumia flava]